MFLEYRSDSLFQLTQKLAEKLFVHRAGNPLQPSLIVVQNKEVQQWVTLQVAKELGLAANLNFILPSEFIWFLYRKIYPGLPKNLPSDRIPLQLQVFDCLEKFEQSRFYCAIPFLPGDPKRKFQFARQIADVFDLYQVFRPELIKAWSNGRLLTQDATEPWQRAIWMSLKERWDSEFPNIPNRAEAFFNLIEGLNSNQNRQVLLPKQVYVMGLSQYSVPFVQLISVLARLIDVHFFKTEISNQERENNTLNFTHEWYQPKQKQEQLLCNGLKEKRNRTQAANNFYRTFY